MNKFKKYGILFLDDFFSMMVMNLFFLLLVWRARLVNIRLDLSRNMYCLLVKGKKILRFLILLM